MGRVKQAMYEEEENNDLIDFLNQLIAREEITGAALGIAKQVVNKGVNSMTERQKSVIDNLTEGIKRNNICERCSNGNVSILTDYLYISENKLCPMCQYDEEQFMKD